MIDGLRAQYVFVYLTEKCNLSCRYCYFQDKRGRTLTFDRVRQFLDWLNASLAPRPCHFIISGGEPCLVWPLVRRTVSYIRSSFPGSLVGIQTNATLLDAAKIGFIKKHGIHLEIGIDGGLASTRRYRKGVDPRFFRKITDNIGLCLKKGIDVGCTMTVAPSEAKRIRANFRSLANTGLKKIDITPAAFMPWGRRDLEAFKEEYLKLLSQGGNLKRIYTTEDRLFLDGLFMDFSLHPPGYVFCGDAYLCLSEGLRKKISLLAFNGKARLKKSAFRFFLKEYAGFYKKAKGRATYRDYISWSFKIIDGLSGGRSLNAAEMVRFQDFFKKTHLLFLSKRRRPALNSSGMTVWRGL